MKIRGIAVLFLALALALSGLAGPRHAKASAPAHGHSSLQGFEDGHSHQHGNTQHSHDQYATHSHSGTDNSVDGSPVSDQGCCYSWCNSVAVMQGVAWSFFAISSDERCILGDSFRIGLMPAAIDPPPR